MRVIPGNLAIFFFPRLLADFLPRGFTGMDLEPKMEPKIGVLGALSPPDERGQPGGASSSVNGSGAGSVHPVMSGAHFGAPSGPLGPDSVIGAGLLGPGPHGPPPPPGLGISRSALEATCGSLQSVVGSLAAADTTSAGELSSKPLFGKV